MQSSNVDLNTLQKKKQDLTDKKNKINSDEIAKLEVFKEKLNLYQKNIQTIGTYLPCVSSTIIEKMKY